eukprot:g5173.t1
MRQLRYGRTFPGLCPLRLKGKLAALEDFISMQNEELAAQRQDQYYLHELPCPGLASVCMTNVTCKQTTWRHSWQEIESLRGDKAGIEEHYQGQLQELKKTMVGDVQRLQDFESRK